MTGKPLYVKKFGDNDFGAIFESRHASQATVKFFTVPIASSYGDVGKGLIILRNILA